MKTFKHINASTLSEAVTALGKPKAQILAGGADLMGVLKDEVLPVYPRTIVNLKTIPGLDYIRESDGFLRIGALTRIADIARDSTVKSKYTALAEAAGLVGSPQIREMGTIGGNICQLPRCWYFRLANNRFFCLRKGGKDCPAISGDSRYHSIFGGVKGCMAVNPSDIAPALLALDAKIKTTQRVIEIDKFFSRQGYKTTVLDADEIVTEIQIPVPASSAKSAFIKYALRKSIDFPLVNCAVAVNRKQSRIYLNAVYNIPYRAIEAEKIIAGKSIDESTAEAAGEAAVANARALEPNRYKIQIAKVMVKRTLLACNAY